MYKEYQQDLDYCRSLQKKHGRSAYYFSTLTLPKEKRDATFVLYAFLRVPDEFVDRGSMEIDKFAEWRREWGRLKAGEQMTDPVLRATAEIFKLYSIPFHYGDDFLDIMEQDIHVDRYETYKDLQQYMYGSAGVVGLMMSHILGYKEGALPYAELLGEAMQYTNFLRDVAEDYQILGRIYIPQEVLKKHNVSEKNIAESKATESFKTMMKSEIARAHSLFKEANPGISKLESGQYSVRVASALYESILDYIEKMDYDVLNYKAKVPIASKLNIARRIYVQNR